MSSETFLPVFKSVRVIRGLLNFKAIQPVKKIKQADEASTMVYKNTIVLL